MAFGKNPEHLNNIPPHGGSLGQRARAQARKPPRNSGGGGGEPYWKNCHKLSSTVADIVRLIAGDFSVTLTSDRETSYVLNLPYLPYREHHNGSRGCICSGGVFWAIKGKGDLCPSCGTFFEDVVVRKAKRDKGDMTRGPNRMSVRDRFAYTVYDYGLYFKVPDMDRNGTVRTNKEGTPYTHWEKGDANDPKYAGKEHKYGHLQALCLNDVQHNALIEHDAVVGVDCVSCGNRGCVSATWKICGNSQCGQPVYEPRNCALTAEQRQDLDNNPYMCPHCNVKGFIDEIIACAHCQNPKRATIFDVDIQLKSVGAKEDKKYIQIINTSEPRPIQIADPETAAAVKSLPLDKKFAPTSPDTQYSLMSITRPTDAPTQQVAQYAAPIPQAVEQSPIVAYLPPQTVASDDIPF